MIISPLLASTARPSMVRVTFGGVGFGAIGARHVLDVGQELVAEHAHAAHDGARDRGAEGADRGLLGGPGEAGGDVVAGVEEQVEVGLAAPPGLDALEDLFQPAGPFATRRALAA